VAGSFGCDGIETNQSLAFNDITQNVGLCYDTEQSAEDSTPSRVAGGIAVDDFDGDGQYDLYVTHGRNSSGRLFKQMPDFSYSEATQSAGISAASTDLGAAFVDINQDGYPELISVQEGPSFIQIFGNNGDGTFSDISSSTGLDITRASFSISAGDYDLDGDLDLFFTHWSPIYKQSRWEFLWQNQGDGSFIDVSDIVDNEPFIDDGSKDLTEERFEYSFTGIFANVNKDITPDLLLAADFGSSQILLNSGGTTFIDNTTREIDDRAGMGTTVIDYDNDGDLDWFVSAIGDTREEFLGVSLFDGSRLYQNDGDGNFTDVTDFAGVKQGYWGWGVCFADFNNDGDPDLFAVNGYDGWTEEQSLSRNYVAFNDDAALLYISNGDGTFTERGEELGMTHTAMGRGLACYDYDRDGDIDMLIANSGEAPSLYRNNTFSQGNNFLNVRLKGTANNPHAVGARVYISINGEEQFREMTLGSGFISQNPVEAHFGIGDADVIDKVRIVWPTDNIDVSEILNVEANRFLIITQPD
jgi:hypothetical protein